MSNPLVSILIPMYNSSDHIEETLKSCLDQMYENIEIIVVDDGSKDNSVQIVEQIIQKSDTDNIKILTQKNKGACAARNLALENSLGDYIQFLDADDVLSANKISSQIQLDPKNNPENLLFCRWVRFANDITHTTQANHTIFKSYKDSTGWLIDSWMGKGAAQTACWLVHKDTIKKAGLWDENLKKNQDGDFFARVILASKRIVFSEQSIVYYRASGNTSISSSMGYEYCLSSLSSLMNYEQYTSHIRNPDINRALACNYSHFYRLYYPLYPDLLKKAKDQVNKLGYKSFIISPKWKLALLAKAIGFKNAVFIEYLIRQLLK